jgi:hypothetical protein
MLCLFAPKRSLCRLFDDPEQGLAGAWASIILYGCDALLGRKTMIFAPCLVAG